jgi:hypothetical protein
MHPLIRVIRRRVFDHGGLVAELGGKADGASMQVWAMSPITMS